MRPVLYFVTRVGDHWEVRCRLEAGTREYRDRDEALRAAQRIACMLWERQLVATEVMVDDEDGRWHRVAAYGSLLG
ncbi:MAG TPA: hypothetical protein VM576_01080 [Xanthomonadaceae bacterium]|nr:hypothetical protein [Xanthomonadaceae bacterium]